ncbi:hypothetical protein ACFPM0_35290 [Pseudonocardia sulfidoxydans]|uniref:hypothetical protein n=1 Tax=Pseudonocardia sulfidoxydans TaxID=54011 RepID=UPI0036220EEE
MSCVTAGNAGCGSCNSFRYLPVAYGVVPARRASLPSVTWLPSHGVCSPRPAR